MFTNKDVVGVNYPNDEALVNTRSLVDIILEETLDSLKFENLKIGLVETYCIDLLSPTFPLGLVQLPLTTEDQPYQKTTMIEFQVVDLKMPY